ncbi:cytidylyltransferase domain-containing protein [Marinobacter metalliresistant]|uniref:NTP transferase domain-containing protein n=1 Tax=Marinobacter metalliresistant TaxID=2961995 RepID=A0ABZ2W4J9_9GAMM
MPDIRPSDSLIVVGARLNSSRLPRKHLLELAGVPLIVRVFERLAAIGVPAVLATTADDFNQELVRLGHDSGIPVVAYDGDIDNVVGRVDAVVREYQPERVVYVCGDCPLVSQDYIGMALQALRDNPDWEQVLPAPGRSGETVIHEGILCLSRAGWDELVALSQSRLEQEHVGLALTKGAPLKRGSVREDDDFYGPRFRLSVDTAADWRFMDHLYSKWYASHEGPVSLKWVVKQVRTTDVGQINKHVMQKSGYRSYGAAVFVTEASPTKGIGQLVRSVRLAERVCELAGLGVTLLILGEPAPLECLRTVNHEWIGSEDDLLARLTVVSLPSLIVIDLFPERLEHPAHLYDVIVRLVENDKRVVGLDRLWIWHRALSLVVVPCLVYRGVEAPNIAYGPGYALAPAWLPAGKCLMNEGVVLTVMTGGSDAIGYGEVLPELLDQILPKPVKVKWLLGPYAKFPNMPSDRRLEWEVLRAQADIASVAMTSTVVLSVYGNTVLELLANGIPVAVLPAPGLMDEQEWFSICQHDGLLCVNATEKELAPLRDLLLSKSGRQRLQNRNNEFGAAGGLQRAAECVLATLD